MNYPATSFRVKASLIDAVLILLIMVISAYLIDSVGAVPDWVRAMVMIILFVIYEPLTVGIAGGTLGHRIQGLEVRRVSDTSQRIGLMMAIIRVVFKFALGLFSILTSYLRSDNRCIHDLVCGSVVVYRSQANTISPSLS
ncbi:RDD family protein [Roseivirga misakiensis]|uniref:RDD domain-containing protein n=1 Tax=Roseivirga misakiensis TaxID=1563681 RepID=A0A1E5SKW5_9BACT|nr:RDD family protein [Roseivirga misakiensis]OEJ99762.1 hypothetical protein BFP71_09345 [Roseivirga misakiensis]